MRRFVGAVKPTHLTVWLEAPAPPTPDRGIEGQSADADVRSDNVCRKEENMRRLFVVGRLALGLSAVVAASAGAVVRSDGRSCTTQRFGAVIQSLSADGVALKVAGQDRPVTFRLLPRTQIRKQDRPVGVAALAVGQKVVAEVRTCQGGGGPTEVALVSLTWRRGDRRRRRHRPGEPTGSPPAAA